MKGKECKHIDTGHIGRIGRELSATKDYPEQWGIYWYGGNEGNQHGRHIQEHGAIASWQDKTKIILI